MTVGYRRNFTGKLSQLMKVSGKQTEAVDISGDVSVNRETYYVRRYLC